jgi:hypothetical protein
MDDVVIKDVRLPSLGIISPVSFSVNSSLYEQTIAEQIGELSLPDIVCVRNPTIKTRFWELDRHFFFNNECPREHAAFESIIDRFSEQTKPCSMFVRDFADLDELVLLSYFVAHEHYATYKRINSGTDFPNKCCGYAASNIFCTLLDMGFSNAVYADSNKGHSYVALPFVMRDSGEKGFIVIDPTSDQMWKNIHGPRNHTFVIFGDEFEYKTDWIIEKDVEKVIDGEKCEVIVVELSDNVAGGADLFPDKVIDGNLIKNKIEEGFFDYIAPKILDSLYKKELLDAKEYFKSAFENPVNVDVAFAE